jgi:hypothetical protein
MSSEHDRRALLGVLNSLIQHPSLTYKTVAGLCDVAHQADELQMIYGAHPLSFYIHNLLDTPLSRAPTQLSVLTDAVAFLKSELELPPRK